MEHLHFIRAKMCTVNLQWLRSTQFSLQQPNIDHMRVKNQTNRPHFCFTKHLHFILICYMINLFFFSLQTYILYQWIMSIKSYFDE